MHVSSLLRRQSWATHGERTVLTVHGHGAEHAVKWHAADRPTITRILRNPAYAGVYAYGLTEADPASLNRKGQPRRVRRPVKDWIWIEEHHESYVSLHVWANVQKRLTENRNTPKRLKAKGNAPAPFAGKGDA